MTIRTLEKAGLATDGLRSKSWDEFAVAGAPDLDFIFTVCDNAANETCPIWPGRPMTAHWGIEDPANAPEAEQKEAFRRAMFFLNNRMSLFLALPLDSVDEMTLRTRLSDIGKTKDAEPTLA